VQFWSFRKSGYDVMCLSTWGETKCLLNKRG
jgi:hypothetical protein